MKVGKHTLAMFFLLFLRVTSSQAQESAFEVLLPYTVDYMDALCAETADGHYLVSPAKSMILKLSRQGIVVDEMEYNIEPIDDGDTRICALLTVPGDPAHHIVVADSYLYSPYPNATVSNKLHIIRIDDNLSFDPDEVVVVDLSEEVKNYAKRFNARFFLDEDGSVCWASNAQKWDDSHCLLFVRVTQEGGVTIHFDSQFSDYGFLQVCDLAPKNGHYDMMLGYIEGYQAHLSYCEVSHEFEAGTPFHFATGSQYTTLLQYDNLADSLFTAFWHDYDNCAPIWVNDSVFLLPSEVDGGTHFSKNVDYGTAIWKMDSDFNILKYVFLDVNHDPANHLLKRLIARNPLVINNEKVYFCYTTYSGYESDPARQVAICKLDTDLNLEWKRWYGGAQEYHTITDFMPTNDGGCFLVGQGALKAFDWTKAEGYVLKITADGYCGSEENGETALRPYSLFPNPVEDQLHMEYSPDVTPRLAELYDVLGRLVGTQNNNLESVNMRDLPAGTYTLRIVMEDGTTYSDKVVKQ